MKLREENQVPPIFSLNADLRFIHGDTRLFSRNEALRAMAIKFQVLKSLDLIEEYLESVILRQWKEYFLG